MEDCVFEDQSFSFWRIQTARIFGRPEIHLLLRIPPTYFVPARTVLFIYLYSSSGASPHAAMIFVVPTLYFLSATLPLPHSPTARPLVGLTHSFAYR